MIKHAALIIRLSPRSDGKYEGVDDQEKWGREYAARHWPGVPIEVFADKAKSATRGDHRPELERFLDWLAAGRIAHVWAVEQSRVSRETDGRYPWFSIAAQMDSAGVDELHTNRDGIVRIADEVAGIKAVLSAAEARKIKTRTRETLAERAAEGRPGGGHIFGYRSGEDSEGRKTLEVVPDEAEIIRDAADKILAGWSLANTAAELNRRGVRGRRGKPLSYSTLKKMLTNPTVAGQRQHRGEIVGPGVWEPILDMGTWQAVNAKLAKPRAVRDRNGDQREITEHSYGSHSTRTRRRFLLTGGIAVAPCGGPMKAQRRKVKARSPLAIYTCSRDYCVGITAGDPDAAEADGLEPYVRDRLFDEIDKPEFLERVAAGNHAERREELVNALEALGGQRRRLAKRWADPDGGLTDGEWDEARAELAAQERGLRDELAALPPPVVDVDLAKLRSAWPRMNLDERREVIALFITRVWVLPAKPGTRAFDSDRVDIVWRMLRR